MFDLEVWLIGTPADVAAALAALTSTGRLVAISRPQPLPGADTGRIRRYLRVSVPTPTGPPAPGTGRMADRPDQAEIDLDARRGTGRRTADLTTNRGTL